MSHLFSVLTLRGELGEVRGLFAVVVHVHAQTRGVAHALLADVALQRALARVVLVPDVHLQVVPVREEPMTGRTLHAARFAVPTYGTEHYKDTYNHSI